MMIKDYEHLLRLQRKNAFKVCESEMMIVRDLFVKN